MKDLFYSEKRKTLIKKFEDNVNKWKAISCCRIERISTF